MISRNNIQGKKGIGLRPILTMSWSIQYSLKLAVPQCNEPIWSTLKNGSATHWIRVEGIQQDCTLTNILFFCLDNFFPALKNGRYFCTQAIQLSRKVTQIYFSQIPYSFFFSEFHSVFFFIFKCVIFFTYFRLPLVAIFKPCI